VSGTSVRCVHGAFISGGNRVRSRGPAARGPSGAPSG
jgi:hypothetical protein